MRLLVIEDELPMRIALVKTLQAEGYRVVSAADGPGGLEAAFTENVDLILLDVMLPGLDGYALCRELRQHGHEVSCEAILDEGTPRACASPPTSTVTKPCDSRRTPVRGVTPRLSNANCHSRRPSDRL